MPDSSGVELLILYDNVSYPQRDTSKHAEHWISPSDERFRISFDSKPEDLVESRAEVFVRMSVGGGHSTLSERIAYSPFHS